MKAIAIAVKETKNYLSKIELKLIAGKNHFYNCELLLKMRKEYDY